MGHHRDETYSKESFLPDKPTSWLKYYKAPSRLKKKNSNNNNNNNKNQALTFPAKFPLLFNQVMIFPKNREFGSLVVRP